MTTIVICGVLAAAGMATYQEYVLQAKIAESYVTIAALSKAQATNYHDIGYFPSTSFDCHIGPKADGYHIPSNGTKSDIGLSFSAAGDDMNFYKKYIGNLNGIIPDNTTSYFAYMIGGGNWDDAGQRRSALPTFPDYEVNFAPQDGEEIGLFRGYTAENEYIEKRTSLEALGLYTNPKSHFSTISAVSKLKPDIAVGVVQIITASGGEITLRAPFRVDTAPSTRTSPVQGVLPNGPIAVPSEPSRR